MTLWTCSLVLSQLTMRGTRAFSQTAGLSLMTLCGLTALIKTYVKVDGGTPTY